VIGPTAADGALYFSGWNAEVTITAPARSVAG